MTGVTPAVRAAGDDASAPFYFPSGNEIEVFEQCHARRLAVMLKGPTGCGKTRFVEHMAHRLGLPLVTVSCHDDLTASDLVVAFSYRGQTEEVLRMIPFLRHLRTPVIAITSNPDSELATHADVALLIRVEYESHEVRRRQLPDASTPYAT